MYKLMYRHFRNKGIVRKYIFKFWYNLEWFRMDVKEVLGK